MKRWNFKAVAAVCAAVVGLTVARLGVSIGRLVYSLQTDVNVVGGEEMPTWQSLVFGDGFFYLGCLALAGCILCTLLQKKKQKAEG